MSLFKIRQFWSTTLINEDKEFFDQNSLHVSKINSDFDYVLTGSQSGVLRIFSPCYIKNEDDSYKNFDTNDLVVEKVFDYPILQLASGRFMCGSQDTQLAILHPKLLSIYSLIVKAGKTDHGTETGLQLLYEHKLKKSSYSFVVGPFGGCKNRDLICVQSLDGILSFFEHENHVTHVLFPEFLLPGPFCYSVKSDCFINFSADWSINAYRYKVLSDAAVDFTDSIDSNNLKIISDWSYNLGEAILDIQIINDIIINKETWIVVLGEKNFYCLTENGRLKYMIKLNYSPICVDVYVINTNLFTLLISETAHILVYENTTLKWCAKIDYLPISIKRAFLNNIKGALVLLSEEGRLECCYLGTEPSLFVAPPVNVQEIDFIEAEKELLALESVIKLSNNDDSLKNNVENDLKMTVSLNRNAEFISDKSNYLCELMVDLLPHVQFQEIQISFLAQVPLKVEPSNHFFSNICDAVKVVSKVSFNQEYEVATLDVEIKISVINNFGIPRMISGNKMIPMDFVFEICEAEKECKYKITISVDKNPVKLMDLFDEYKDKEGFQSNLIGFRSLSGNTGTILLAKSMDKYRIQSNTFTILAILMEQLGIRLRKANNIKISFNSSLPADEIFNYVRNHFEAFQRVKNLQNRLLHLSSQFRLIQKRLISKYKTKTPIPLKNLELLLNDTFSDIAEITEKLEIGLEDLKKAQSNLSCSLSLVRQVINLLDIIIDESALDLINSAFCLNISDLEGQGWEDVLDAAFCYLLRTILARTEKDKLRAAQTSFDEIRDLTKLEKHLTHVLERISKLKLTKINEDDVEIDKEETPLEEDKSDLRPIGSQYGEFSTRLLSARKSLMRRHQINENLPHPEQEA